MILYDLFSFYIPRKEVFTKMYKILLIFKNTKKYILNNIINFLIQIILEKFPHLCIPTSFDKQYSLLNYFKGSRI